MISLFSFHFFIIFVGVPYKNMKIEWLSCVCHAAPRRPLSWCENGSRAQQGRPKSSALLRVIVRGLRIKIHTRIVRLVDRYELRFCKQHDDTVNHLLLSSEIRLIFLSYLWGSLPVWYTMTCYSDDSLHMPYRYLISYACGEKCFWHFENFKTLKVKLNFILKQMTKY